MKIWSTEKGSCWYELFFWHVSLQFSVIKPPHAKWTVDLYNFLKEEKEKIMNGFRAARITEAINDAKNVKEKLEKPFVEDWSCIELFL